MTGWIIAGSILFIILFLLLVPLHIVVRSDAGGTYVYLRVLFIKYPIYPGKKERKKKKKEKTGAVKNKEGKKSSGNENKSDVTETISLVTEIARVFLEKLKKYIRVRLIRYRVVIATDDAAKTAVLYGAASSASAVLMALLATSVKFHISRDVAGVYADFTRDKSEAEITLDFIMTLIGGLFVLLPTAMAFIKRKNKENEPENINKKDGKENGRE